MAAAATRSQGLPDEPHSGTRPALSALKLPQNKKMAFCRTFRPAAVTISDPCTFCGLEVEQTGNMPIWNQACENHKDNIIDKFSEDVFAVRTVTAVLRMEIVPGEKANEGIGDLPHKSPRRASFFAPASGLHLNKNAGTSRSDHVHKAGASPLCACDSGPATFLTKVYAVTGRAPYSRADTQYRPLPACPSSGRHRGFPAELQTWP